MNNRLWHKHQEAGDESSLLDQTTEARRVSIITWNRKKKVLPPREQRPLRRSGQQLQLRVFSPITYITIRQQ